MSKNIKQIFDANPAASMSGTDLFYLGRSPYGVMNDMAITWTNTMASITAVGTVTSGTWNATVINPTYGGTGVNNGSNTLTLAGNLATSGANSLTLTTTAPTNVTLPTSGTLVNSSVTTLSSLISVGTIGTGTWQATLVNPTYGGTGVNNGSSTITIGGNITFSGAFTFAGTVTGNTTVTFPTSGTLATTSQLPVAAALTKVDDTNVTLTLGGTPATALLQATSITAGWTGQLGLTRGGSGASLTASTGGIVYSGASALAILSGTPTANLPLLSGSSAAPTWGSFALSLGGALTTAGALTLSGAFGATFTFTNTTSVTFPTSGTLATTSQTITNVNQNSSSATLVANSRYATNNGASLVTYTIPAGASVGDTYIIVGGSSGGWTVAQPASVTIHLGSSATTAGVTGTLSSSNQYDCVTITCVASNVFTAYAVQGNLTVV